MKALFRGIGLAFFVFSLAALTACGDSGDSAPPATATVATADLSVPITAANSAALSNVTQTFSTGIPEFGTTVPTTLAFSGTSGTPSFTIAAGTGVATGNATFGSCIFNITASTIPGLIAPRTITVGTCSVKIPTTAGVAGVTTNRPVSFTLGALTGTGSTVPILINANGDVTIGGFTVGRVTVTVTTGASS